MLIPTAAVIYNTNAAMPQTIAYFPLREKANAAAAKAQPAPDKMQMIAHLGGFTLTVFM
jgi:hypothetical protein